MVIEIVDSPMKIMVDLSIVFPLKMVDLSIVFPLTMVDLSIVFPLKMVIFHSFPKKKCDFP